MPSTSLRDLAYDPDAQTLDVTFITSGRRYRYFGVTLDEHDALIHSPSKGRYFNARIKPLHDYRLLFDPAASPPSLAPFLRP
jgi:KTSC domain-containing protein